VGVDRPDPRRNGNRAVRPDRPPATPLSNLQRPVAGQVSALDRVTLQLGVAVAVVIAVCSYAVSATSLYALGVQAGYSWWQAAAVPVVADGPAIYGMFRIISRSRRGAPGAGYGWLLVGCGTLASIGGNVAHARPDLVAQAIAAAIPLAVLAMLEGLKGDAGEVTRLAAQAADLEQTGVLQQSGQVPQATTVRRPDRTATPANPAPHAMETPSGAHCPPDPARPTPPRSERACRPPMPSRGPMARPGRPAPWPRRPAAAAAAPPASCNANAHRLRRIPGEPPQMAAAGGGAWLCLPRHPGAAPAPSPPPPWQPPASHWRPPAWGGVGLFVSGSGLRPACQASLGLTGPPWGQRRHL
jgi:hypothetical protein